MFQLLTISLLIASQVSYARPLPQEQFADCSASYSGELIPDKNIKGLLWGWENEKSCKKSTAPVEPAQQQPVPASSQPSSSGHSQLAQELLNAINNERKKAGLGEVQYDERLNQAAQKHSELQAQFQKMDHQLPNEPPLPSRIEAAGYTSWTAAGENVAWNQPTVTAVVEAWMNSPGHRANILNPVFTQMGFGYAVSNGPYWTNVFGRL